MKIVQKFRVGTTGRGGTGDHSGENHGGGGQGEEITILILLDGWKWEK